MPTTGTSKQRVSRQRPTRGVTVDVIEGPLLEISPSFTKQGSTFRIGRTKASKLQIKDETVSEKHGELKWNARKGVWEICDRGSSNGTFVNGEALGEGVWRAVETGDEVRIGETTVVRLTFWEGKAKAEELGDAVGMAQEATGEEEKLTEQTEQTEQEKTKDVQKKTVEEVQGRKRVKHSVVDKVHKTGSTLEPNRQDKENAMNTQQDGGATTVDRDGCEPKTSDVPTVVDTTVLEHIETHCAKLERDLVEQGAEAARQLREAWQEHKTKILERLTHLS